MPTEYSVDKEDLDLTEDVGHPFLDNGKEIIDGNIVEECRGYDNCKDVYRVFASLTDDARRQNDVNSAWRTGDVVSFTFFKEVNGVFEAANYSPVAVPFANEPNAFYTTIEWRDVLDQDGAGCFKLVTNSQIAGFAQPFINWQTYTLEPYMIGDCLNPNVVGTARILSEFNDVNDFLGLDFTGSFILDSVRLNAKVGYFNDNTEIDMVEYVDGNNEKVSIEDFVSYELRLNLSGFCVVEFLRMHLLQANSQWISDYNYDSYSYLTDDVPVVLKEGLEPEFFDGSRNIKGVVKFRDKVSRRRTHFQDNRQTSEADRPPHVCPIPIPPTPVTQEIMKTGQTIQYRTGDDGAFQAGRGASFLTLPTANVFGNTFRFTDELGGQTFANDIVIDWSTYNGSNKVLGWYSVLQIDGNWNASIDASVLKSVSTFTTGWRMPNRNEMDYIINIEVTPTLNYVPFNQNVNLNLYMSSSLPNITTQSFYVILASGIIGGFPKTSGFGGRYMICREFTVTGTTLT